MLTLKDYVAVCLILLTESLQGYPYHKFLAIGLLNFLSDTVLVENEEAANELREIRLQIHSDIKAAIPNLNKFIFTSTYNPELPFLPMLRDGCYDCCIKHLTTAYTYLLCGDKHRATANIIEAYNEAPQSENNYIADTIMGMLMDNSVAKTNIPALVEYVHNERVKNGM